MTNSHTSTFEDPRFNMPFFAETPVDPPPDDPEGDPPPDDPLVDGDPPPDDPAA